MTSESIEAVAIIGMAGRFPGARDLEEFWSNLRNGTESIATLTDEELLAAGVPPEVLTLPNFVRSKGVLRDVADFDAHFFGFNPREAEIIDPQHRMFLESCWHALEDAGYDPDQVDQRIGMYAGCGTTTYLFHLYNNPDVMRNASGMSVLISNDKDYLTTRASYKLNLRGPSVNVQSACSTSLVAVAMAAQSLLNYQCDMALAGGVSIRTPELSGFMYQEGGILSPDGHCRAFDEKGQGTVFSSGLGVVVLKRLSDALADHDHIYAVIRGSAVNNDGQLKIGFTAPSVDGQVEAAAESIAMAGVDPEDISYYEAHGTATQLGDPIEIGALSKVFRAYTPKKGYCAIGSVKTNIGHTDIAAGVAGLIKTALSLKHQTLVPSLHFNAPNPELNLDESPFYVNTRLVPWQRRDGKPLIAGVSSFGVGGTNANVILEEAPMRQETSPARPWQLLSLAARSETALEAMSARMAGFLKESAETLPDIAFTSKVGRRSFDYRRIVVCADAAEAVAALEGTGDGIVDGFVVNDQPAPVAFMFSGQGSQYVDMGRGLYLSEPVFRDTVDECCRLLRPHLGLDLREIMHPKQDRRAEAAEQLRQTAITQPALFVIEYAMARLWMSWGIQPDSMIGHSIGEYVAACISGVFSLEDALSLIALRGKLMNSLPGGAMIAIMLPEERALSLLDGNCSIAAVNAPSVTVVSGSYDTMAALEARLKDANIMHSILLTSHAFHSSMMDSILPAFDEAVAKVQRHAPTIPYISNVTGHWITEEDLADPHYWSRHLRGTVRFAAGVAVLLENDSRILLELGPGQALQAASKSASVEAANRIILGSMRPPKSSEDDNAYLAKALAGLWVHGAQVAWAHYYAGETRYRVPIPGYAFERERYYVEPTQRSATPATGSQGPLRRKPDLSDWFHVPTWKGTPASTLLAQAELAQATAPWLIFSDGLGLGERLAGGIEARGQQALIVRPGTVYRKLDALSYEIDPLNKEHYAQLFRELRAGGQEPGRVLHLWNVTASAMPAALSAVEEIENSAFYGPMFLGQAVADQKIPTRVLLVSNHLHDLLGEGNGSPAKSLLVGPCRLITKECAQVHCRGVDIAWAPSTPIAETLIQQLIAEAAVGGNDTQVVYRGGMRWVEDFESVQVKADTPMSRSNGLLRERGTYLITGGIGGLGLVVAQHLARQVRARLVLTGRSDVPAREHWETWLTEHHHGDATSQRIRGLIEVEKAGGELLILQADVADLDDMRRVKAEAARLFGQIDGIFHAAGIPGGGLLPLKTRANSEPVLRPKVRGTLVLHEVFGAESLDFVFLFSSVSANLAGTGQIDYTAANAFLESFAVQQRGQGRNVFAVGWDTWSEVGMGVGYDLRSKGGLEAQGTHARIEHGLLQWRQEQDKASIYSANIDGSRHWALGDHRIVGRATLVGTAYIDMAVSAMRSMGEPGATELTNVYLLAPLTIEDAEQKTIELELAGEGAKREFKFRSRLQRYGEEEPWQEHVIGSARQVTAYESRQLPIDELLRRLPPQPVSLDVGAPAVGGNIAFGPRWANLTGVGVGEGEALGVLELPEAFAAETKDYTLHPALLDVATSFAKRHAVDGFFLPMSYRRLLVKGTLSGRVYSYVRYAPQRSQEPSELISFDISLLDAQGHEVVAIEGYVLKRVPEEFIAQASKSTAPAATRDQARLEQGILTAEGVEVLQRLLDNELPARIIVSRLDMNQRIERSHVRNEHGIDVSRIIKRDTRHKRPKIRTPFVAPRNDLEEQVAEVWQSILGIEQVGVDDGFIELGGNSLLAVQVISRLREAFEIDLPLEVLYRAPTVAGIAECVLTTLLGDADSDEISQLLVDMEEQGA